MNSDFLDYYNRELGYLREMGGEFAAAFPKVASRLGMQGDTVADPYVERLLEGFAFLAARIHVKLDSEFPRFSQRLLEVVYPHYLAPTPAMAIVQLVADEQQGEDTQAGGMLIPRATRVSTAAVPGTQTPCTFTTGQDVEVWPIDVLDATAEMPGEDLGDLRLDGVKPVKGIIRLHLRYRQRDPALRGFPDGLSFHIAAEDPDASVLYEAIVGRGLGVVVRGRLARGARTVLGRTAIKSEGFGAAQALLPTDSRVFQGYRLLHEYFAFPRRYLFFSLSGLEKGLRRIDEDSFELVILLDCDPSTLGLQLSRKDFELNCVPVINLFPAPGNRLLVTPETLEHHVVADRTRPLDFEVYRVDAVNGFDRGNEPVRAFRPFYHYIAPDCDGTGEAFFSVRRAPRRISEPAKRSGGRSGYLGSEVYLSLVDTKEAPWPERIDQLTVDLQLTNRDLPLLLPTGDVLRLEVDAGFPVHGRLIKGPTRPRNPVAEREMTWRLISHLSLNYLALRDMDPASGAGLLRELLGLYAALADPVVARHAEAITTTDTRAVNRRLPVSGPLVFGRGVAVAVTVDERPFAGGSPYLFGAVLEQFLSRHVSMNMFCELELLSTTRGSLAKWPPRWGGRPDV